MYIYKKKRYVRSYECEYRVKKIMSYLLSENCEQTKKNFKKRTFNIGTNNYKSKKNNNTTPTTVKKKY